MTEEEKIKIVEGYLAEELDRNDDDSYEDDSTVEELIDDSDFLKGVSERLKYAKVPKKVKMGDLSVSFEPNSDK